jgi:hypothetical protein
VGYKGQNVAVSAKNACADVFPFNEILYKNGGVGDLFNLCLDRLRIQFDDSDSCLLRERFCYLRECQFIEINRSSEILCVLEQPAIRSLDPQRFAEKIEFPLIVQEVECVQIRHRKAGCFKEFTDHNQAAC